MTESELLPPPSTRESLAELAMLLQEIQRRSSRRKITTYYPDEGPLRRELYRKHLEFFAAVTTCGKSMITGPSLPSRMLNSDTSPVPVDVVVPKELAPARLVLMRSMPDIWQSLLPVAAPEAPCGAVTG